MRVHTSILVAIPLLAAACTQAPDPAKPSYATEGPNLFLSSLEPSAASTVHATPSLPPTATPTRSATFTPTATETPGASLTPTLGPPITRTPAPPAQCPKSSAQVPTIELIETPEDFEVKLLNYLNARRSGLGLQTILASLELGDGQQTLHLEALVINRDLTGDTTPDVLVEVIHPGWNMGNLLVFVCNAGRYEMDRLWVDWNWLYEGLRDVLDMNRDGIPEIVFTWDEGAAHGGIHFVIMEWTGNGFQSLAEPGGTYGDPGIWAGDGVITDADGNGTIDLLLSGDWTPGYGPGRTRHELWAWNGVAFTFHRSYYDPPVYRFQAVYDGDSASDTGQYDAALASYQSAIFDEKLLGWGPRQDPFDPQPGPWDPGERPRLEAYSRYRILLLHAVQNHWTEGQTLYETLQGKFPAGTEGHPFAELASEFWLAFEASRSIANACAKAISYASIHADEITAPISWPAYGDNEIRRYMPDDVCPFK